MDEAQWLVTDDVGTMLRWLMANSPLHHRDLGHRPKFTERQKHLFEDACFSRFGLNLDDVVVQEKTMTGAADILRDIVGNPFRPLSLPLCNRCDGDGKAHGSDRPFEWTGPRTYPGPCPVCNGWKWDAPWLTKEVVSLAQAAYDERNGKKCTCWGIGTDGKPIPAFGCPTCHGTGKIEDSTLDPTRLAILADALIDAGCPEEETCGHCPKFQPVDLDRESGIDAVIAWGKAKKECRCGGTGKVPHQLLQHLRSPGPHHRGCWATDAILGKE